MSRSRTAPIWLMGMSNLTFGLYTGFTTLPLPQLLAAQHVPGAQIGVITAAVIAPGFWTFLLGPVLDVRFSRRWYATVLAAVSAVCLALTILNRGNVRLVEWLMMLGYAAGSLSANALGGWLATIVRREDEAQLSSWSVVAGFGGYGLMTILAGELVRALPLAVAAFTLGAIIFLPTAIFLLMPAPGPDRRLAGESFRAFFGEVWLVVRRREALLALALFLLPSASFCLTNLLGGWGADFHADERTVNLIGGSAMTVAGIVGSLLFIPLAKLLPLRPLYLAIGCAGAIFTASLLLLGRNPTAFGLALAGENVFQALAFTGTVAICYETIGRNNPLAATQYGLLTSASNLPIIYMQLVDGRGYAWRGVTGAYLTDAGVSLAVCGGLGAMLYAFHRRGAARVSS
ncbi:MFS transporter, PAT family, beta-lactamase induction signal transducer AmpG [Granulicella rosea]|uniref:MFS transporter, PAT family, beta-lactamase induction signal transducer AmpG n=1 Tax=Granulicella rosea TaxID=474952 RepID=A0A239L6U4_9BACT|nr:MFS transporter [Granulicella rosea]SNT26327.1 MFS transporter, PAT family, beta-lactamase induction signal transducer AmpG [Granulicella rosea]